MKLIIIFLLFCISALADDVQYINMYTEHYPPYNMKDRDGNLAGSSIEVLDAVLKQMHSKQSIKDVKLRSWGNSFT